MAQFDCLRCGAPMRFVGQERLQLGKTSWLFGDLPRMCLSRRAPPAASWNFSPAAVYRPT